MSVERMGSAIARSLTWVGRGLVLGVAAVGLVVGAVLGQIIVARFLS